MYCLVACTGGLFSSVVSKSVCRQGLLEVPGCSVYRAGYVDDRGGSLTIQVRCEYRVHLTSLLNRLYTVITRSSPTRPGEDTTKELSDARMSLSILFHPLKTITIPPSIYRASVSRHNTSLVLLAPRKGYPDVWALRYEGRLTCVDQSVCAFGD
jgi:hypothetical protein